MRSVYSLTLGSCAWVLFANAALASPSFFGLSGRATDVSQDQLISAIESNLTNPLDAMSPHVKSYYNYQADGEGNFQIGVVAEAEDAQGTALLGKYVSGIEQSGFLGFHVQFENVVRIGEHVTLVAGLHSPAFTPSSQTEKDFGFSTLTEWENFTNNIGFALMSKKPGDFQGYLVSFFGGASAFQAFADQVLAHNDTVVAELDPTIVLANGVSVGPESQVAPFFDVPFVRNCWDASYEHGMCYASH